MINILFYSLDKIDAIKQFYGYFESIVQEKVNIEVARNKVGNDINLYFKHRISKHSERGDDEKFRAFEEQILSIIDIKDVVLDDNNNAKGFKYLYRNLNELKENNCELNPIRAAKNYARAIELHRYYSQTSIVNLITRFEEFIAEYAGYLFRMFPQAHLNEKTITYAEIEGKTSEAIMEQFVAKEVDTLMRKDQDEWFKMFKAHKIRLDKCCNEKAELIEIIARRHMIIHNSGKVNSNYIQMVKGTSIREGTMLEIDKKYVDRSIECIKIIMYTMIIEGVKMEKASAGRYLSDIFYAAFEELMGQQYEVARVVFNEIKDNSLADDIIRTQAKVNEWIAQIELGRFEAVKDEIENFDTEGLQDIFLLAKLTLLREFDKATLLLKRLLDLKQINIWELENWPLFIHYRESPEYIDFKSANPQYYSTAEFNYDEQSEIDKEIDDLIEKLEGSDSFKNTHKVVQLLDKIESFNVTQQNRIVNAALSNFQIRWIINDEDIKQFYLRVIESCASDKIKELRQLIQV